jgi:hypothetical protein
MKVTSLAMRMTEFCYKLVARFDADPTICGFVVSSAGGYVIVSSFAMMD